MWKQAVPKYLVCGDHGPWLRDWILKLKLIVIGTADTTKPAVVKHTSRQTRRQEVKPLTANSVEAGESNVRFQPKLL